MTSNEIMQLNVVDFKSTNESLRGSGSFGKVVLCKHRELGFVVVKCFTLITNTSDGSVNEDIIAKGCKEANLLLNVDHCRVVKSFGYVKCDVYYGIVMEYAQCRNLHSLIIGRPDIKYTLQLSLLILTEIADGLHYLHSLDKALVHGDLKPENILLSEGLHVKIADLGSARHPSTISIKSAKDYGTPGYIAPERYLVEALELSPSVDVYSFAVIAFQLVKRVEVSVVNHWQEKLSMINNPDLRPGNLDDMEKNETDIESRVILVRLNGLIKDCWNSNAAKRWETIVVKTNLEIWMDPRRKEKIAEEAADIAEKLKCAPYDEESFEMPLEECFYAAKNYNDPFMIVVGGQATKRDAIAIASKKCNILPLLAEGRCHHSSIIVQKKMDFDKFQSRLYVMGGINKSRVLKSVEYLDLKKDISKLDPWKFANDMHECRYLASAATLHGKIYILGGKNEKDEILNTIECFSIDDEQWSLVQVKLAEKRFDFNIFLHNDFIYCCGGLNSDGKVALTVDKINPKTKEQEILNEEQDENKYARYAACTVKPDEDTIWFIGGLNKFHRAAEPPVLSLKVNQSLVSTAKPTAMKRSSFAAAMADRTVYVLGGHGRDDSNSSLMTYEQIDLTKKSKWSLSLLSDLDSNPSEKVWAGHSMVAWKPEN